MSSPLMLDLIAKERRKIRQEIAEEYSQEQLEALAKRARMPVEEFLECEVERRMKLKHAYYGEGRLRGGRGHKGCRG